MYIYRPHRGLLADAMKESKEFNTKEEMFNYIVETQGNFLGQRCFGVEDLIIKDNPVVDHRIGWLDTRYVCTKRWGDEVYAVPQCIGMCATNY